MTWAVRALGVLLPEIRNPSEGNGIFVFALDEQMQPLASRARFRYA